MTTSLIERYNEIVGTPQQPLASEQQLERMGYLLDRLEELEIYQETPSITSREYDNATAEIDFVNDELAMLTEYV